MFPFKFKLTPFLFSFLVFGLSQVSYNVTILIFHNALPNESIVEKARHMFQLDSFPQTSKVINLTWLQTNASQVKRRKVGVLGTLHFLQNLDDLLDGAIFHEVTKESIAFSSLLEISGIPTFGLFQDQEVLLTQVQI